MGTDFHVLPYCLYDCEVVCETPRSQVASVHYVAKCVPMRVVPRQNCWHRLCVAKSSEKVTETDEAFQFQHALQLPACID